MNIAVLSRSSNIYSTNRLVEAIEMRGHEARVIDHTKCDIMIEHSGLEIYYQGELVTGVDAIIPRIGASVTFYGCAVVRQFEMMDVFSVNRSISIVRSRDKLRSMQMLAGAGLGLPKTAFTNFSKEEKNIIQRLGGAPLIIKLLEGTQGLGVVLAETQKAAKSVVEAFHGLKARIIVQEFIKEAKAADIRAFVVDGEVVGAMKRQGLEGEFRSNLHRGGTAELIKLKRSEKAAAVKAAKVMGLNMAGVDLLQSDRGPLILEVNSSPGLEGIENATGIDIAGKIVEYVERNHKKKERRRTHNLERTRIKIGTRKSKLALWQANHVADLLDNAGFQPELLPIETKGDKIQNVSISKIGSKGVFTEELELSLARGKIDIAVHSAKDLPSKLPDGFTILSFCERESPDDVIVAEQQLDLNQPNLILGTSSTRRIALLKHYYPNIQTVEARGNLQTRMEKLKSGIMQGLVLAYAGVRRMNFDDKIQYWLDIERFVPPVGQGAVAIEVHERLDSDLSQKIKSATNHALTEQLLRVERAFLKTMDGGCSIPVFAFAQKESDGQIELVGGIASLDGKEVLKRTMYGSGEELGISLAEEILASGGKKILDDIKSSL